MQSGHCAENDHNSENLFSDQPNDIHDPREMNRSGHEQKWKIMVIDDDEAIHMVSRLVFDDFMFMGQGVEMIYGYSGAEARQLINENPDTAVILLDVVMETDQAGLDVVNYIRQKLNNKCTQIILRTGQAGQLSEVTVARDYEINDYKDKSALTMDNLTSSVITSLRSYREMKEIKRIAAMDNFLKEEFFQYTDDISGRATILEKTTDLHPEDKKLFSLRKQMLDLINNSTAAMNIKDRQGRYVLVNAQFEKLLNMESEALIGNTNHGLFSIAFADKISQGDNDILNGIDTLHFNEEFIKYGKRVPYMTIKFPLYGKEGMPFAICSISTEILQPKK